MPIINNPFNGKLNLDVADYRISNGDYIDALNITKDAQGRGQDKVVSNIVGNTLIPFTLPSGENKIIGFFPDKIRNRAYYFLWNSNGYNTILYYDLSNDTITKVLESKTDSDGIDILNFNPSYKVLSVNIIYRDDEGDLLFFNDGNEPPKVINVSDDYGTNWKYDYLLVIKAPPIMPPKAVYENDDSVTINNLRNTLFQFSYRFVYDNNEKSVWSSKSIVPLPQQPTSYLTDDTDITNNSRIALFFSTGDVNVKEIELCYRETKNGNTSDWFLIGRFNKAELNISNNIIYNYNFYNDNVYSQIDVIQTSQLQDYVPQTANAGELANGNVLLYAGITEGYDKTNMNLTASSQRVIDQYYFDKCGLLFFASCMGVDSGIDGTILKIYVSGTGTNTNNIVSQLNNAASIYVVNVYNNSGVNIGCSYTNNSNTISVNSLLSSISSALIANGYGWTQVSLVGNVLTMSNSSTFKLLSSGTKIVFTANDVQNTTFANSWQCSYQYAIQYFDAQGRTIGAQTSIGASFETGDNNGYRYPQTTLYIKNRPPLEADYYQVLRSNNISYNKILYWVSSSAYSTSYLSNPFQNISTTTTTSAPGTTTTTTLSYQLYAYIDVSNIEQYNKQISSTSSVVSYSFTPGDRIRFFSRIASDGSRVSLPNYDYEILGVEYIIQQPSKLIYRTTYPNWGELIDQISVPDKEGVFIKIKYPYNDINDNFKFNGNEDFFHYEILLYNLRENATLNQREFFEFGKCFGIGNKGTNLAYHIGLEQTQSSINPIGQPAIVSATNGDLFYRKRTLPTSDKYSFVSGGQVSGDANYTNIIIGTKTLSVPVLYTENYSYKIQTQPYRDYFPDNYPTYSESTQFFLNKTSNEILLNIKCTFNVSSSNPQNAGYVQLLAFICTSVLPNGYQVPLSKKVPVSVPDTPIQVDVDTNFVVPPNGKVWIPLYHFDDAIISTFNLDFSVVKNSTINIIEQSFSDNYNIVTNSNGRPSVIEENAKKTYYPTLIRFSQAYQANTSINGTNNFYFENFDEYDRGFGDVMRLHVRDRYLKVYQKFKVGNVPILTQIVKDSANNPLQANTDTLINKIQYYAGDYGIGDAATSLAWNNFSDYFVDNYRGVVCRLSQDGITPLSIVYGTNAFFVPLLQEYRQELNNGVVPAGQTYMGNPCIYGVFDAYTNKYIIAMEEINRYQLASTTTTTTTAAPVRLNWSNTDGPGIDSDLYINGNLQGGGTTSSGYIEVPANSSVIVGQNSGSTSGLLGRFDLTIINVTESNTLYSNTVYAVVSTYQTLHSYTFVAEPNNVYQITAYGLVATTTTTTITPPPTTTTTTTTALPTFNAATSLISESDACSNPEAPSYSFTIVGGSGSGMCDNVQISSFYINPLPPGDHFWTKSGGNVREWQVMLNPSGYNYAIGYLPCASCGTTTTASPTITTTTTTNATTRYYYNRYNLDANCNSSNATLVWSYNVYANGYWNIGGTVYELTAEPADTTSIQITSATAASCNPGSTTTTGAPTTSTTTSQWPSRTGYRVCGYYNAEGPTPNYCGGTWPALYAFTAYFEDTNPLVVGGTGIVYSTSFPGSAGRFYGKNKYYYIYGADNTAHFATLIDDQGVYGSSWITCPGTAYSTFSITTSGKSSAGLACNDVPSQTVYAIASQSNGIGVTNFYTDVFCVARFNGNGLWWSWEAPGSGFKFSGQISSLGATSNINLC